MPFATAENLASSKRNKKIIMALSQSRESQKKKMKKIQRL